MKKTLSVLLMLGAASSAFASLSTSDFDADAAVFFDDLTINSSQTIEATDSYEKTTISYTASTGTFTSSDYLSVSTAEGGYTGQDATNVALTLDLDALRSAVDDETMTSTLTLVTFVFSTNNALALQLNTSNGSVFTSYLDSNSTSWTAWSSSSQGGSVSLSELSSVLVIRTGAGESYNGDSAINPFVKVYAQDGTGLLTNDGLGGRGNGAVTSISVDTDYVTAVGIAPTASLSVTSGVADFAAAAVPEPTTATLSLLALAGLAARRRRK